MDTLIHADVFFFVSTLLLSAVAVVFIIAIIYVIRLLQEARSVATIVREEAEKIASDVEGIREKIRDQEFSPGRVFGAVSGFLRKRRKGRKQR